MLRIFSLMVAIALLFLIWSGIGNIESHKILTIAESAFFWIFLLLAFFGFHQEDYDIDYQ
jgi:hypothetical protein